MARPDVQIPWVEGSIPRDVRLLPDEVKPLVRYEKAEPFERRLRLGDPTKGRVEPVHVLYDGDGNTFHMGVSELVYTVQRQPLIELGWMDGPWIGVSSPVVTKHEKHELYGIQYYDRKRALQYTQMDLRLFQRMGQLS
ncbi:hypothetical protein ACIBH1_45405 [Nonomuraea sp. NPDC050663]|uniref:hypothetical protein n=1 Tax=Nonomuraea sp. NPDC050663 TaxID=3364370 RepID=UPI00379B7724